MGNFDRSSPSPTGSILAAQPQVLDKLNKVGFLKMFPKTILYLRVIVPSIYGWALVCVYVSFSVEPIFQMEYRMVIRVAPLSLIDANGRKIQLFISIKPFP